MNFILINDDYYNFQMQIDLRNFVPEFKSCWQEEEEEPYLIIPEFRGFLIDNIENEKIVKKGVSFINHALSKGGYKTEDIIVDEVFDDIYCSEELINKFKPWLDKKSLILFEKHKIEYDSYWNSD